MNVDNLYNHYLVLKPKYNKEETLFLVETNNYFFAFNRSAFTIRELFITCVCSDILKTKQKVKNHVFYTAIPKMDYDIIINKISKLGIRTVFITPL